jgi:bifunctional oligoribonuclease and PAP phosphatase NrnA
MSEVSYPEAVQIGEILSRATDILIIQADNPDVDSLASSLALEGILHQMGKNPILYCGVNIPSYLGYLPGSDRVTTEFPNTFDASIIVDTSSVTLLEQLTKIGAKGWLAAKDCIVIDHHATEPTIDFAKVICNHSAVSTGEVIYELTNQLDWQIDTNEKNLIANSILGDSLGLMTPSTTARSIQIISELVSEGVNLPELEAARRESQKREPELVHYKGLLLQRVEFYYDDQIATVTVPWEEIEKYSPLYNPPMLVLDDMRLAKGVKVAICFKLYTDGKITTKIRCNHGYPVAAKLAEHFGGGGHEYAAGFKILEGRDYEELKKECIEKANELLSPVNGS